MADRQTTNVSLTPAQAAFLKAQVDTGRYRTASEAVRDGIRMLEEAEHRRLLEKWLYQGLSQEEEEQLPEELIARAKAHFQGLVDQAMADVDANRIDDGPSAMQRLRDELEDGPK